MSDLVERMRKCSERVSKSKFPDYHAARWLEKGADRIEALEAAIKEAIRGYDFDCYCVDNSECCGRIQELMALKEDEG